MTPIVRYIVLLLLCGVMLSVITKVMLAQEQWFAPVVVWGGALALATVDAYFRRREDQKG